MPLHRSRRAGASYDAVLSGDLQAGPLAPQVDAGRGFDDVDDVGAADARGGFEEVPGAIARADELGVRHAAEQPERLEDAGVQLLQCGGARIAGRQRPRDEDAGVVRHDEGRRLVAAHARETHLEAEHDRIDVEDVTRNELFEEVVGPAVAERLERVPQITG